jgi:hypothetical protein
MRGLRRCTVAFAAGMVVLAMTAPEAMAKGEGHLVGGSAVVTGPGLSAPVVVRGPDLARMLAWIGPVAPRVLETRCCSHFMSARPSRLGPRYDVRYELRFRNRHGSGPGSITVVTMHQDLYPYAPNEVLHQPVPWAFTPAGQTVSLEGRTVSVESSWIDSSLVFDLLVARGLPAKAPPAVVAEATAGPGGGPVTVMGLAALGVVLVVGALAARRASRPRSRVR